MRGKANWGILVVGLPQVASRAGEVGSVLGEAPRALCLFCSLEGWLQSQQSSRRCRSEGLCCATPADGLGKAVRRLTKQGIVTASCQMSCITPSALLRSLSAGTCNSQTGHRWGVQTQPPASEVSSDALWSVVYLAVLCLPLPGAFPGRRDGDGCGSVTVPCNRRQAGLGLLSNEPAPELEAAQPRQHCACDNKLCCITAVIGICVALCKYERIA